VTHFLQFQPLAKIAKVKGMNVIALTGESGGKLREHVDVCIRVPEQRVDYIQELHLPVYHNIKTSTMQAEEYERAASQV